MLDSSLFAVSARAAELHDRVTRFMKEHIYPVEDEVHHRMTGPDRWQPAPVIESLKHKARDAGLWNLFLPDREYGAGLGNLDYAPLCEQMGRVAFAPQVFNCSAPDTGNMEILARYGSESQKRQWLMPLLAGEIRSAFAMTEPDVASSDATNIRATIHREGDEYVLNGHKWWTSGLGDPRCRVIIFMGKTDPEHPDPYRQQAMVLVPCDAAGIRIERMLSVFGYDGAPHGHADVIFDNVRVPAGNILLGPGRGFEIAQGRLGPGRIHHCMRLVGLAERSLDAMCQRVQSRVAFGRRLAEHGVTRERIAEARIRINQARLLCFEAARQMDVAGNKAARQAIGIAKVAAPRAAGEVIDWAIQAFGGAGVSQDAGLAHAWTTARFLRIGDGPDEVHRDQIARLELKNHPAAEHTEQGT